VKTCVNERRVSGQAQSPEGARSSTQPDTMEDVAGRG
jgi:hypothetical protein